MYGPETTADPITEAIKGKPYLGFGVDVIGAEGPFTFALVGDWPSGLHVDANGFVSGTPTESGVFEHLSVQTICQNGDRDQLFSFTINVSEG